MEIWCPRCRQGLPAASFHQPVAGRRHGYCKECRREYNREWYRRNTRRHLKSVEANNQRYLERNRAAIDRVKDAPCMDCGSRFPATVMEFDHVRGEKRANVSELVRSGCALETVLAEVAKCDLVCANCHRVRTAATWPRGC